MNAKPAPDVGSRIRELREHSDLSLRALAEMCDVSPNTISLVERGVSSPSVDTLQRLATGLGVPITALFETGEPAARLVLTRSADRVVSGPPEMPVERLASGLAGHAFASFMVTMEQAPSPKTRPIEHSGVEWVYCLEGGVTYEVEGQEYRLAPGDSLLFDASLPHCWQNPGSTKAQMILVLDVCERDMPTVEQHLQAQTRERKRG